MGRPPPPPIDPLLDPAAPDDVLAFGFRGDRAAPGFAVEGRDGGAPWPIFVLPSVTFRRIMGRVIDVEVDDDDVLAGVEEDDGPLGEPTKPVDVVSPRRAFSCLVWTARK